MKFLASDFRICETGGEMGLQASDYVCPELKKKPPFEFERRTFKNGVSVFIMKGASAREFEDFVIHHKDTYFEPPANENLEEVFQYNDAKQAFIYVHVKLFSDL